METFTVSRKEVHRPGLLKALCAGRVTTRQVAKALGLSLRQTRRRRRRCEAEGAAGLAHRSRGRPSSRGLAAEVRAAIGAVMTTGDVGFNDRHLTEKRREPQGLCVSRESVRRVRQELGVAPRHRRRPALARRRRRPEAARGALVQIDGSPWAGRESRGPQLMLLGAIDDATSEILARHCRPAEDVHGYTTLFQQLFTRHGRPLALYGDRLNLRVRNDRPWSLAEELAGRQFPTHLGRMRQDLGIGYIAAPSPQAKGRIERRWGTRHDRLVSALRVRGIATVAAASAYRPAFIADFNRRFGQPPAEAPPVWRRAPAALALVLSCRYRRVVAHDNTVRLGSRWAPLRGRRSWAGLTVEVRELLAGRLVVLHDGVIRARVPPPPGPFVLKPRRAPNADRRLSRQPPTPRRPTPPRSTPKTHTGRRPWPTHPWVAANDRSVRQQELKTGRTFSRSRKGGHFH